MRKNRSLKYKIGMTLIILSIISPVFSILVPFLSLPAAVTTTLVALFMVGAPEVFLIAGGALAGKEALATIKSKLFRPAGKIRYQVGMVFFACGVLTNWVTIYLELLDVIHLDQETLLVMTGSFDLVTIAGILLMGVEFFQKLKRLFIWEGAKENADPNTNETNSSDANKKDREDL